MDTYVLDRFVRPIGNVEEFRIVNGTRDAGHETRRLFAEKNSTFERANDAFVFDGGFCRFVDEGLNAFLGLEV
jgi:hypothetical protein